MIIDLNGKLVFICLHEYIVKGGKMLAQKQKQVWIMFHYFQIRPELCLVATSCQTSGFHHSFFANLSQNLNSRIILYLPNVETTDRCCVFAAKVFPIYYQDKPLKRHNLLLSLVLADGDSIKKLNHWCDVPPVTKTFNLNLWHLTMRI